MGTVTTRIPAAVVATGNGMPSCCAKHGQPATLGQKLALMSRPPGWTYALIFFGALPFVLVTMAMRKTVTAPAWPFCAECAAARKKQLTVGLSIVAAAVLVMIFPFAALPDDSAVAGVLFLLGFLLLVVGAIWSLRGGWRFQSAAEVSRDGAYVLVRDAHPQFVQGIPVAQHA